MIAYLDSSAVVKRYVEEDGSEVVRSMYRKAYNGGAVLALSAWNFGEVLGVLDRYHRRGWLAESDYAKALRSFASETIRLVRLGVMRVVPVRASLLAASWSIALRHHVHQADALQIVSAKRAGADVLLTGDERLSEVASSEGLKSVYLEG